MIIEHIITIFFLSLLVITVVGIIYMRNILAVVMLGGIYSLTSASLFVVLDAVDVAFTEAAVGAGISMVLFLSALSVTGKHHTLTRKNHGVALFSVFIMTSALLYATSDMPAFGSADAPIQTHVAPRYIEESGTEIGIPNVVTSVLALSLIHI